MADLKASEIEDCEFAFEIFADNQSHLMDAFFLTKFLRAVNMNPSLDTMEKLGATKKEGEKHFKLEEVLPIYSQVKKDVKEQGCYEDFIECLKLYDKAENGKMLAGELNHSLLTLGEKLSEPEVDELFDDCLDEEDDEGEIEYIPFLRRMCEKEPPIKPKKK